MTERSCRPTVRAPRWEQPSLTRALTGGARRRGHSHDAIRGVFHSGESERSLAQGCSTPIALVAKSRKAWIGSVKGVRGNGPWSSVSGPVYDRRRL